MDFTIVTPSFNQLDYLACCIASIADQGGVTCEHIVQDGGTLGFPEFAKEMERQWPERPGYRRIMTSERDSGMYDAVNKGLKKGTGKICAYLNCDEQYLKGALKSVKAGREENEGWEILYGGFFVVDGRGELITAQRPVKMSWAHVGTSHLANFTCATFFTREMLEREKAYFDTQYKWCGDAVWTMERLKKGTKVGRLDRFTSVFVEAGSNQGIEREGLTEAKRIRDGLPKWVRRISALWKLWHRIRKLLCGGYFPQRVGYDIFIKTELGKRRHFPARWANPLWGSRLRMG